jgi:hypothetical protein
MRYSSEPDIQTYGVSRNALVGYLQESLLLGRYPKLKTYFGYELVSLGENKNSATFRVSANSNIQGTKEELVEVKYDLLVGADGANSAVRSQILHYEECNPHSSNNLEPMKMDIQHNVQYIKSLYIRPSLAKNSFLYADHNHVQAWVALNLLFTGMADGSFWGATASPDLISCTNPLELEHKFRLTSFFLLIRFLSLSLQVCCSHHPVPAFVALYRYTVKIVTIQDLQALLKCSPPKTVFLQDF